MQKHKTKIKAFALVAAFVILASFGLAAPHQSEAGDAADKVAVKQEVQQNTKHKTKHKKHTKEEAAKEAEAAAEAKQEEAKPAPPVVITPDQKSYASPNGYQVMIDGREINFRSAGVIYMHGYRYTYYSSKDLYHHRTPEWYACDDNIYRTADGHVVVASADHAIGTIVPTPFGTGKVMDKCYHSGTIDVYVNF